MLAFSMRVGDLGTAAKKKKPSDKVSRAKKCMAQEGVSHRTRESQVQHSMFP